MANWWFFLLHVIVIAHGFDYNCVDQNCTCYRGQDIEYQCPNGRDPEIVAHVISTSTTLDCFKSHNVLDFSYVPTVNVSAVKELRVSGCGLPRTNYSDLLKKLKIGNISILALEDVVTESEVNLGEYINDLEFLETLTIRDTSNVTLNFFDKLPLLKDINIHRVQIIEPDNVFIPTLPDLLLLEISNTNLVKVPLGPETQLNTLRQLHLYQSEIEVVDTNIFKQMPNLEMAEFGWSQIHTITGDGFKELKKLEIISFQANRITNIPSNIFRGSSSLRIIHLGHNPLTLSDYAFANMSNLRTIYLNHCNITFLPRNLFQGSTNITDLYLNSNMIKSIPDGFFHSLKKLTYLNLQDNQLNTFDPTLMGNTNILIELNLGGNRLTNLNFTTSQL